MRKMIWIMAAILMLVPALAVTAHTHSWSWGGGDHGDLFRDDDVDIDFDDKTLILEYRDGRESVEISRNGTLVINDKRVKLDRKGKNLMRRYHAEMSEMIDLASNMGIMGAKMGLEGTKLGGKAALHALKELFSNLDLDNLDELDEVMEDIEMDFEDVGEELEKLGEELEELGEELEDVVDDLDKTHRRARSEIDELDDLGWF